MSNELKDYLEDPTNIQMQGDQMTIRHQIRFVKADFEEAVALGIDIPEFIRMTLKMGIITLKRRKKRRREEALGK